MKEIIDFKSNSFLFSFILLFAFYALVEYIFNGFFESSLIPLLSAVPSFIFFMLFRINGQWDEIAFAAIIAFAVRILFDSISSKENVIDIGVLLLDIAAIILKIYWNGFSESLLVEKLVFIALVVLSFSSFQRLFWGRRNEAFPFYYFLMLGIILLFMPMNTNPINWSKIENKLGNFTDAFGYYLNSAVGNKEYVVGYGSFNVTGASISNSNKLQIILDSVERPYFVYTDLETNKKMKVSRSLYLAGGKGVDKRQLFDWLQFLHNNGVDKEKAAVFSQISKIDEEYVYLDTKDEIAPAGAVTMSNQSGKIVEGVSTSNHKKGYRIKVKYIDIDYGSPYLQEIYRKPASDDVLTYNQAREYYMSLYNQELKDVISQEEYESFLNESEAKDYCDTTGSTDRMKELAKEITSEADNEYDKARLIESYLRQYTYSKEAVGGYNEKSTMSNAGGMADIADRFLFDTKSGYCVHYTSSMVTLLRLSGIPARAVKGYRYVFPLDVQDEYMVEANCAHVWPEAYIKNVGWVPFEPTSSYKSHDNYSWHRLSPDMKEAKEDSLENLVPDIPQSDEEVVAKNAGLQLIKIIAIVALSLVILFLLLVVLIMEIRKLRYILASDDDKLKIDVDNIKDKLEKHSGRKILDRGLLMDYLELAPEELKDDIAMTFNAYYRVIYAGEGRNISSEQERNTAKRMSEFLNSKEARICFKILH